MVDFGHLRGQQRENTGSDDTIAREVIASFKQLRIDSLPIEIDNLNAQIQAMQADKEALQDWLQLLVEYNQ